MYSRFVCIILAATLLGCASKRSSLVREVPKKKIFFYKLSKGKQKSYILGTMHYGLSLDQVSPKIKKVMRMAKTHVYEILYSKDEARYFFAIPKNPLNLYRSGFYETARAQGKNEVSKSVAKRLTGLGVPAPVASAMSDEDCDLVYYRKLIFTGRSMDLEALSLSRKWKKKIVVLDNVPIRQAAKTLDEHSGMDFSCSIQKKILEVPGALMEMDNYIEGLQRDYRFGNAKAFANPSEGVKYRNLAWARQIQKALQGGSSFIAVGADHLQGPNGLLRSLKDSGFRILQISL